MEAGILQNLVKINGTLSERMIAENTKHIVNCDIKPANLLVNHNIKLIDLASDQSHAFSGTTAYMAPDRFDSWSALEIYIGHQPYFAPDRRPNKTEFDLIFDVRYEDSPVLPK
ncbi:hypothetical protein DCAR_0934416 [Daucus carota subsp. sativus]|uniref:Protein kinase domain-containing protein n=1 Tax=Daucus carota subsp. sativus TaxID=79200 RepID=A0AAF1BEB1_DAUCS|nr:hypothetical protein DCAR_0934416 [Daucus carota subsp. sativus]